MIFNLEKAKKLYLKASDAYYNGKGEVKLTDAEFDALEQKIAKLDPDWPQLKSTGVRVKKKERKLAHFMPSLTKYYPATVDKWLAKQRVKKWLYMSKLDGGSIQLVVRSGRYESLITRGDGEKGGDITHLLPYLKLPQLNIKASFVLRMEALMFKKTFDKLYSEEFENPRNLVNGWLNRIEPSPGLKHVHLVVLGVYGMEMKKGLDYAAGLGFETVDFEISSFAPSQMMTSLKTASAYEMDGLVMCDPRWVLNYDTSDKPKQIVAYKENADVAIEAKVKSVIWQDSRRSRLIPKIELEPVRIGGVTVTYCAVHNAKWLLDRKIGPGAVVQIIRSGDVIPKIVGVKKEARKMSLPDVDYRQEGVHFVALVRSKEADVREIHNFMKVLGIEFLASKTLAKLYDAGFKEASDYIRFIRGKNPVTKLIKAGVGEAMSVKICGELLRVFGSPMNLRQLMVASNCFDAGIGDRKLKLLEATHGPAVLHHMLDLNETPRRHLISRVKGFGPASAELVLQGLNDFGSWLEELSAEIEIAKPEPTKQITRGKFKGRKFSFTGYRDKAQETYITHHGGEIVSFGKHTQTLLYKSGGKQSSKIDKARDQGITVLTFEDLTCTKS